MGYVSHLGASDMPPASQLGEIRSKRGYRYQITPTDLLWLGRAVQFEGGDEPSTIWTYAQRQAHLGRSSSLASLVRAHSQPINPLWDELSDAKCQRFPRYCQPHQLERRRVAASTPWPSLRPEIRGLVTAWAQAKLPNPVPGAVDFADPTVSRGFLSRTPGSRVVSEAGNWYIALRDTLGWPVDYVTVNHRGREAGAASPSLLLPLFGVGAFVAAGGFAYWAWRRAQR